MIELFVGLAIGAVVGWLARARKEPRATAVEAPPERESKPMGWERSVRAMRERQQSNNH
jgi:hypothetical protein